MSSKTVLTALLIVFTALFCAGMISCNNEMIPVVTTTDASGESTLPQTAVTASASQEATVSGTQSDAPVTGTDTDQSAPSTEPETKTPETAPATTSVPATTTANTTNVQTATAQTTKAQTTKAETTKKSSDSPYKADLSEYEKYMDPTGDDWSDAYLVLVNEANPAPDEFEDSTNYKALNKRVKVGSTGQFKHSPNLYFNEVAFKAFIALTLEAKEDGIKYYDFCSAYRSYQKQDSIFSSNIKKTVKYTCSDCGYIYCTKHTYSKCAECGSKSLAKSTPTYEEAAANVKTYSCAPGTSEHQTGLAADIIETSLPSRFDSLLQEFGDTKEGIWLEENCWRFGFIIRFPKDKEDVTGIIYEPWHIRFVGRTHATKMHELNMCLEEYIEYLEQTGYFD